jgi:hypothetical protein
MLEGFRLRAQCGRMLRSLDIQPPLDITELSRRLGEARGRPIRLIEMSLTGSLGYSLPHGPYDVCVYEKNTSEPHQNHIICHELGHIMFRHLDPGLSLYWADDCGGPGEAADLEKINRNIPFDGFPRRLRRICFDRACGRAHRRHLDGVGRGSRLRPSSTLRGTWRGSDHVWLSVLSAWLAVITYLCGAVAAGLCAGAVLLSWAVAQHPHDRVLRYFALVITLLAVQQVLVIDEYATSAFTRLATNMLGLGAGFGKVCFFRTALWCTGQPRPRLRMEFAVVVAVGCVEIVCLLLAPAHVRPAIGQPQNGHLLTAFIFELVTTGYLASVSCRVIWWDTVSTASRYSSSHWRR